MRWWVIFLVGCGAASTPDDAEPERSDAIEDSPGLVQPTFEWNPWPAGPVAYRRVLTSCDYDAAAPGRCQDGFDCTQAVDIEYVALTREERVCVPTAPVTRLIAAAFEDYAPTDPRAVSPIVLDNGVPFVAEESTIRVLASNGAEVYSGPVTEGLSWQLDAGEYTVRLNIPSGENQAAWNRGGLLTVVDGGTVTMAIEHAIGEFAGVGSLEVTNLDTGITETRLLPTTTGLVPGTHRLRWRTAFGTVEEDDVRVIATETLSRSFEASPQTVSGDVRVDGTPLATGKVVFFDPTTEAEIEATVVDGRYTTQLLDRPWAVYLDTREVPSGVPRLRALAHETIAIDSGAIDLSLSTVTLRGDVTLDASPAPVLGERFGFLQLVDAIGIAGAGLDVLDGHFEGRVYASRADLVFIGTHSSAPRLGQTIATAINIDDAPVMADIRSAELEVRLTLDGGIFPQSAAEIPEGRGVLVVRDGSARFVEARIPPRGEAIARLSVPPGTYSLRYRNESLEALPISETLLGEVTIEEDTALTWDLHVHEINVVPPASAGTIRFTALDEISHVDTTVSGAAPGIVRLFDGVYRARDICTGGCGRLVWGWFEVR